MQDKDKEGNRGDDRHDGRHKKDSAKNGDASCLLVEKDCQQQTKNHLRNNRCRNIPDRVEHGKPEAIIDEQNAMIVLQSQPLRRQQAIILGQAVIKAGGKRPQNED